MIKIAFKQLKYSASRISLNDIKQHIFNQIKIIVLDIGFYISFELPNYIAVCIMMQRNISRTFGRILSKQNKGLYSDGLAYNKYFSISLD